MRISFVIVVFSSVIMVDVQGDPAKEFLLMGPALEKSTVLISSPI